MVFRGRMPSSLCRRDVAPKETFTRSQLAAVSSIFMDFRGFHRFIESSDLAVGGLSFHGSQGSEVSLIMLLVCWKEDRKAGSKDFPHDRRSGEVGG